MVKMVTADFIGRGFSSSISILELFDVLICLEPVYLDLKKVKKGSWQGDLVL